MSLWRELILNYHTSLKIKTLVVHDCPLWKNQDIQRDLDRKGIETVMDDFVKRCVQFKGKALLSPYSLTSTSLKQTT